MFHPLGGGFFMNILFVLDVFNIAEGGFELILLQFLPVNKTDQLFN